MMRWIQRVLLPVIFIMSILTSVVLASEIKSVTLKIEGMTCITCPPAVKKAISRIEGVQSVQVSFWKGVAYVQYEEGKVTVEDMIRAVERIGYKARL